MVSRRRGVGARRGRGEERGATMFIVLMVLMILSAIGTFALSTARYEVETAGYRRQRAQASEAAEFGGFAAQMSMDPTRSTWYVQQLYRGEVCTTNLGVLGLPCYHIYAIDVERMALPTSDHLFVRPNEVMGHAEGSFGLDMIDGGFVVELTEPAELQRPVAGWGTDQNANTVKFIDLTVTSLGTVFLDGNLDGIIQDAERPTASFASARGHVIVGPLLN